MHRIQTSQDVLISAGRPEPGPDGAELDTARADDTVWTEHHGWWSAPAAQVYGGAWPLLLWAAVAGASVHAAGQGRGPQHVRLAGCFRSVLCSLLSLQSSSLLLYYFVCVIRMNLGFKRMLANLSSECISVENCTKEGLHWWGIRIGKKGIVKSLYMIFCKQYQRCIPGPALFTFSASKSPLHECLVWFFFISSASRMHGHTVWGALVYYRRTWDDITLLPGLMNH